MSGQGESFSILDSIAVVSFMIGLANYSKNTDQLHLQDAVNDAVFDIHSHIKRQDEKLDEILRLLRGGVEDAGNQGSK